MKKTVVVYQSISGFTKRYAEWISQDLNADIFSVKKIKEGSLTDYDVIIFGGSLHAVGISGVAIIKRNFDKLKNKKLIIFATGASPSNEKIPKEVLDKNFTPEQQKMVRFFYFRGGFDFSKLDIFHKIIMTMFRWMIQSKKNRTPDEEGMLSAYSKPMDYTNKDYIKELVDYAK